MRERQQGLTTEKPSKCLVCIRITTELSSRTDTTPSFYDLRLDFAFVTALDTRCSNRESPCYP